MRRIKQVLCLQQGLKNGGVGWARRARLSPTSRVIAVIGKAKPVIGKAKPNDQDG
jgi:hypothetical protein